MGGRRLSGGAQMKQWALGVMAALLLVAAPAAAEETTPAKILLVRVATDTRYIKAM